MEDHRLPKKVMIWNPPCKGGRVQARQTWMYEIMQVMTKKELQNWKVGRQRQLEENDWMVKYEFYS